jgi:tRNA pseudouridine synthase 10
MGAGVRAGVETAEVLAAASPEKALALMSKGLCDRCLGRFFCPVKGGADPLLVGRALRERAGREATAVADCFACEGICGDFEALERVARAALDGYEFKTMLVGTTVDPVLAAREAKIAEEVGLSAFHPLKQDVNREVGRILEASLARAVDHADPDIAIHLDARFNTASLQVKSAYFRGRYRKLTRGIPQTRWPCRSCRGRGCARCGGTGKMYPTSVEEIVARPLMRILAGTDHALHGAGREDVDALMLGRGRPFIVEIREPKRRTLDFAEAARAIADEAKGQVEVEGLTPCAKAEVAALKDADWQKTYRVLVALEKDINDDQINRVCAELSGCLIDQQTPTRVAHRRADKVRKRRATSVRVLSKQGPSVELEITGESGLYVKELIHGDEGRTIPNFAKLVGVACTVSELDVLEIHDG